MRIAITGATGFVGSHLAKALAADGHEVILIARAKDRRAQQLLNLTNTIFFASDLSETSQLSPAFANCHAVAHCAGVNRELGLQTYQRVHVQGTRNVTIAAQDSGVRKVVLLSFLRARPACGSPYHESKWSAEQIVRNSGLDYTIVKAGVIYGRGDHMLDHLSHALFTFPIFATVGCKDKPVRPMAVEDLVQVLKAALVAGSLSRETVFALGPEEMLLSEAVRRVARVIGKQRPLIRMPLWFHYALGRLLEATMRVPMVSVAQVRILSEGIVEPLPACAGLPLDLMPRTPFSDRQILLGLPEAGTFSRKDFKCCA